MLRSFPDILKDLMEKNHISQEFLAEVVGIRRQSIASYLAGKTEPSLSKLRKIAVFFKVPTDYLCGMDTSELFWLKEGFCARLDILKMEIESIQASYRDE